MDSPEIAADHESVSHLRGHCYWRQADQPHKHWNSNANADYDYRQRNSYAPFLLRRTGVSMYCNPEGRNEQCKNKIFIKLCHVSSKFHVVILKISSS